MEENSVRVATPDSITSAQKATTQKVINDYGLRIAGFAWRPTGINKSNKMPRRTFMRFNYKSETGVASVLRVVLCLNE